jgi:hypothetical protein
MNKIEKIEGEICIHTCFHGDSIDDTYETLVSKLGEPTTLNWDDNDKTQVEWILSFNSGTEVIPFTLYNWKDYENPANNPNTQYNWHIGLNAKDRYFSVAIIDELTNLPTKEN